MKYPLVSILLLTLITASCKKDESQEAIVQSWLEISFKPEMNGTPLLLNESYTNIYGENFSPSALKFYVGQFQLYEASAGNLELADQYNLIDLSDIGSLSIRIPVAPGNYDRFAMQIGIDSARNVSGVQTGVLDPALGMFWTWNSGYIFMKFEGNSSASTEPNGIFQYHIGGFQSPYSAIRRLETDLSGSETWQLDAGKTLHLDIACQMDAFFNAGFPLQISSTAVSMTPGDLSSKIADNFAGTLSVVNYAIQ